LTAHVRECLDFSYVSGSIMLASSPLVCGHFDWYEFHMRWLSVVARNRDLEITLNGSFQTTSLHLE